MKQKLPLLWTLALILTTVELITDNHQLEALIQILSIIAELTSSKNPHD